MGKVNGDLRDEVVYERGQHGARPEDSADLLQNVAHVQAEGAHVVLSIIREGSEVGRKSEAW